MSLKDYEIIKEIGSGGMGVVYLARDPKLERMVAIKRISISQTSEPELRHQTIQRFHREGRALANVNHHNIVKVFELAENSENNEYCMVMEYINGKSLETLAEENELSSEKVVQIGIQACEALSHIHQKEIIHRDIKPGNFILSEDGLLKLMDFGIARMNDNLNITTIGTLLGSILFMSPEQLINPKNIDQRTDIYALGVTLYWLLAGDYPYPGISVAEVMSKVLSDEPLPVTTANPAVPAELAQIVMKAIEKKKEKRYSSMNEFLKALQAYNGKINNIINIIPTKTTIINDFDKTFQENNSPQGGAPVFGNTENSLNVNYNSNNHEKTMMISLSTIKILPVNTNSENKLAVERTMKWTKSGLNASSINIESLENILVDLNISYEKLANNNEYLINDLRNTINKLNTYIKNPAKDLVTIKETKKQIEIKSTKKELQLKQLKTLKEKMKFFTLIKNSQLLRKNVIQFVISISQNSENQSKEIQLINKLQRSVNIISEVEKYKKEINETIAKIQFLKSEFKRNKINTSSENSIKVSNSSLSIENLMSDELNYCNIQNITLKEISVSFNNYLISIFNNFSNLLNLTPKKESEQGMFRAKAEKIKEIVIELKAELERNYSSNKLFSEFQKAINQILSLIEKLKIKDIRNTLVISSEQRKKFFPDFKAC